MPTLTEEDIKLRFITPAIVKKRLGERANLYGVFLHGWAGSSTWQYSTAWQA